MNDKLFEVMKTLGLIENYNVEEQMTMAIGSIKLVRKFAEATNQLDEQWYLNFLDEINKLSIDQDRSDVKCIGDVESKVYEIQ